MHLFLFFFFNDTATTEIYTLSLHDALPIFFAQMVMTCRLAEPARTRCRGEGGSVLMPPPSPGPRSEEHTSELQSQSNLVCRLLLEKKKKHRKIAYTPTVLTADH